MTQMVIWLSLAGVVVILEMCTGTFYLLMMALGLAAGGAMAFFGYHVPYQLLVGAIVGSVATLLLRVSGFHRKSNTPPMQDPNVNMDIGQNIYVASWTGTTARSMYRGAFWDIDLAPGATAIPGSFTIREISGSRLIVANNTTI